MDNARKYIEDYLGHPISDCSKPLRDTGMTDWHLILFITEFEALHHVSVSHKVLPLIETVEDLIRVMQETINGTH